MASISLKDVGVIATTPLFQNLTFVVGEGDRIGLVAGNGSGKTTLLRCIVGEIEPTQGSIVASRGMRIGLVEQDVPPSLMSATLYDAILSALPAADRDSDSWRVDVALDGFEVPADLRGRAVSALSGGWQRLMLIARCAVTEPDALLLDEPTNHLDLAKIFLLERWLEREARNLPTVIASHDRDFLSAVTNRTLFLRPGVSRFFALPFDRARVALDESDAADEAMQEKAFKQVQKLRKQAGALNNIGINSGSDLLQKKAKYLRERAETIEEAQVDLHRDRSARIALGNSGTHAKVLVALDDVAVTPPGGTMLFRTGKLHVFQGDRIVILGRNGAGKSQLMKLLSRAVEGEANGVRVTASIAPGYVDQDLAQLPVKETPLGLITSRFDLGDQRARALLAGAGIVVEKQTRPIGEFSLGQRARLGLLALRLKEPNFYLMDEPTNHVDIAGQEQLESEILAHGATCILVSHDRRFIRNVGTRFWLIEGRRLKEVDSPEPFFISVAQE